MARRDGDTTGHGDDWTAEASRDYMRSRVAQAQQVAVVGTVVSWCESSRLRGLPLYSTGVVTVWKDQPSRGRLLKSRKIGPPSFGC